MSNRREKERDLSYPSKSSSNRSRNPHPSSSSGRTPYSRPSTNRDQSSSTGILKTVDHTTKHVDQSTSSTYSRKDSSEQMQVEKVGSAEKKDTTSKKGNRSKEVIYVTKPKDLVTKQGTSGQRITLQTNYFKLLTKPDWCLYKYRVDYEPEESITAVRKGLLKLHKEKIGRYIFDGTVLYTTARLPKLELLSSKQSDNTQVKIKIRLVGEMMRDDSQYIQFFNILMRTCLEHLKLQMIGRNYFDANNKINVHEFRMDLWPGYVTSIRQHEHNILMCTEITHKIVRQQTLLDMLHECYKRNSYDFKNEYRKTVLGLVVLTPYNNYTYRIEDIDFEVNPSSTFSLKSGETLSYQQYYKNKYKIQISDLNQPLLVSRTKPKTRDVLEGNLVYLIPELCCATGITDSMRQNFQLMRALARHSCISPESRIEKLMSFNRRLRVEEKVVKEFADWNMNLDRSLLEVPARILLSEKLIFGNHTSINSGKGDWGRNMQNARLFHAKMLKNWVIIAGQRSNHDVPGFIQTLIRVSYGISFRVEQPYTYSVPDERSDTYVEHLERILSKSTPDLVLFIVNNNSLDRYAAIKKKCCIDRPIPSQVVLQRTLQSRNILSIATKIAIQINCKLGGAPWSVQTPKGLMVVGLDICRDVNNKSLEFLAMVATIEATSTRYFSTVTLYHCIEELVDQISANVCKAIYAYRMHNKALPMHIIIYRDGVSDGQISHVYEKELVQLKKKLEETYYGPNFKMTFIVISKRINTKFFYNKRNPEPGTIVDDVVTSPFKYDFFLVSQQVRQGTIAPTSYSIISDNSGLDAENIQQLTYKLTHLYYNCANTVRVPAVCHYAQKLSFLVGRALHRSPNSQLENQLYFL